MISCPLPRLLPPIPIYHILLQVNHATTTTGAIGSCQVHLYEKPKWLVRWQGAREVKSDRICAFGLFAVGERRGLSILVGRRLAGRDRTGTTGGEGKASKTTRSG